MPRIALTALAVLMAATAACGGGSPGAGADYCGTLRSDATLVGSFNGAGSPDFARFADYLQETHALAAAAPGGVKDSWATLTDTLDTFTAALNGSGLSPAQVGEIFTTHRISSTATLTKVANLGLALAGLDKEEFRTARTSIQTDARSRCGVDLVHPR